MKPDHIPSQELTDETLCRLAASGDRVAEERLVMRYNRLVRMCARPYFLAGGDSEDLIQEGMVGLLAAIREYDSSKAAVFRTYAEVCIKNRLFSVIKAAARDKHTPLNNSVSFETPLFSGNGDRFAYHAPGRAGGRPGGDISQPGVLPGTNGNTDGPIVRFRSKRTSVVSERSVLF